MIVSIEAYGPHHNHRENFGVGSNPAVAMAVAGPYGNDGGVRTMQRYRHLWSSGDTLGLAPASELLPIFP